MYPMVTAAAAMWRSTANVGDATRNSAQSTAVAGSISMNHVESVRVLAVAAVAGRMMDTALDLETREGANATTRSVVMIADCGLENTPNVVKHLLPTCALAIKGRGLVSSLTRG
eukprot:jgi/Ulvmu1/7621/UM038_0046.1